MLNVEERSQRNWAVACHLAALLVFTPVPFGNIVGPLIVWLIKRNDSSAIDEHGKESLNFQISLSLYLLLAAAIILPLCFLLVGFLLLPFLILLAILLPVLGTIFCIIGAVKASDGVPYRYPFTLRLIS